MAKVAALLERACAETGLEHFGDDSFHEGLERLVASGDNDARLTDMGQAMFDAQIVNLLTSRLQVEDWYRRHPEIEEEQIVAPLIGLGLPRTGSTALSHMLGRDPSARSLRTWESMWPCPPPETATYDVDPRIARAEDAMEQRARLYPRMVQMLPSTPTSPTECQQFMGYDFKSQIFQAFCRLPSYVAWLENDADLVPTYRYVKRVLKLLQWRCEPKRWRLKNPSHILFIDALDVVFPDARYWMTHRDIASVVPSVADLYFELHRSSCQSVDKLALGALAANFCELGMKRVIAFRDRGNDDRFFDIQFAPFMRDPLSILQKLYDFLGEDFTLDVRDRIQAWRQDTPRDKHGSHEYAAEDFGLNPDILRQRFSFYTERFGVAVPNVATA